MAAGVAQAQVIMHGGLPPNGVPMRVPTRSATAPDGSSLPNLGLAKRQIVEYYNTGRYDDEVAAVADNARAYLDSRLQAVVRPALVLDVDETALSNWRYLYQNDFALLADSFEAWAKRAEAPALAAVGNLYRFARAHKIAVFFVSGRPEAMRACTEQNLTNAGYDKWDGVLLEPDGYKEATVATFKANARRAIERQGFHVVINLGDQDSDLAGGFAEKGFKLPNPMYFVP